MSDIVVKLGASNDDQSYRSHLTDTELAELQELRSHPATTGHILFDPDSEILHSENVEEMSAAVFANVFDICETLGSQLAQSSHESVTFESRTTEIVCLRWTNTRLVVFRRKGNRKGGN